MPARVARLCHLLCAQKYAIKYAMPLHWTPWKWEWECVRMFSLSPLFRPSPTISTTVCAPACNRNFNKSCYVHVEILIESPNYARTLSLRHTLIRTPTNAIEQTPEAENIIYNAFKIIDACYLKTQSDAENYSTLIIYCSLLTDRIIWMEDTLY